MRTVYNFHAYTLRFRCLPRPWRARAWRARRLKKGRHWRRRRTPFRYTLKKPFYLTSRYSIFLPVRFSLSPRRHNPPSTASHLSLFATMVRPGKERAADADADGADTSARDQHEAPDTVPDTPWLNGINRQARQDAQHHHNHFVRLRKHIPCPP